MEGEMLVIVTLLLLNLTPITWSAIPSFLANLEEDSSYHMCDSDMCWRTTFDIEIDSDFRLVRPKHRGINNIKYKYK